MKYLVFIVFIAFQVFAFGQDVQQNKTFHLFTKIYNPDCAANFAGYIIGDDNEAHYFSNLQEFSLISLDVYGGRVKIYKEGEKQADVYSGFGDMKNLRTAIRSMENGTYHIFFILPGRDIIPDTIQVDKSVSCKDLQKIEQQKNTADNIYLGTLSKNALQVPHNKDVILVNPVFGLQKYKGYKISITKGFKRFPHFSVGLSYRSFDGLTSKDVNDFKGSLSIENRIIQPYQTVETAIQFWPSLYSGLHFDLMGGYQTLNAFNYGVKIAVQSRITRFFVVDYGASLYKTTIEGYVTTVYPAFHSSFGLVYGFRKENQFYKNYRTNKKAYKAYKKNQRNK